ncbi:MAG: glutamyl-tRNA reductase [Rhodospirillales bacterium]
MIPLPDSLERLFSVGVTFRSAPAPLRERLAIAEAQEARLYEVLQAQGIAEALVLSTCDRVEVFGLAERPGDDQAALAALAEVSGLERMALDPVVLAYRGAEALRHLFAIAAALDSQVMGEPQVLGQVKASHARARHLGASGPLLERYLAGAYQAAKRVRSESHVGEAPVSLAAAALRVARTLHGALDRSVLLLIGLGELGELLADYFRVAGIQRTGVLHDNIARARALARQLQAQAWEGAELDAALESADIVILSQGAGQAVVTKPQLAEILRRRRGRPMLLLDLSLPSDLGPGVDQLDDAFVYDLTDLEHLALDGKASREGDAITAWRILGEELAGFERGLRQRSAAPSVTALRAHAESLRREILANETLDAEAATALLLKRLLHGPSLALREAAAEPADLAALEQALQRLFLTPQGPGLPAESDSREFKEPT